MTDPTVPNLTPDERQQVLTEGRRRVRNRKRAGITAGALALVAVLLPVAFMFGSSSDNSKQVLVGGQSTSTSAAPSTASGVTSTTVSPWTSTDTVPPPTVSLPAVPPTTVAPEVPTVQTVVPDAATKEALRQAFLTYKDMQPNEIEPEATRGPWVAHVASVNTWWALASYTPTDAMTFQHRVNMQDGSDQGIFTRWDDGSWHMMAARDIPCGPWDVIPANVLEAWGTPKSTQPMCDGVTVPPAADRLVVDADYFLVPIGWHVTPLSNSGGPKWSGSMTDPTSSARIDIETLEGWGNDPGGFLNADGSPNLDSAAAKAITGCAPTTWVHLDQSTVSFTCAATSPDLEVRGLLQVGNSYFPTKMLKVTMSPSDSDFASTIIDFQRKARVGPGPG